MFFYSKGKTLNAMPSLDELEAAASLLAAPGASLAKDYGRWDDLATAVIRVMETGGTLHVTVTAPQWRGPLAEAPEPFRSRITAALAFFAARGGTDAARATVDVIALG